MQEIIVALIGLVAGAVGSLIAPWVHWGVEKTKMRQARRTALIDNTRNYVASKSFGVSQFGLQPSYARIKDHLSDGLVDSIESFEGQRSQVADPVRLREEIRTNILEELKIVEQKWKLI